MTRLVDLDPIDPAHGALLEDWVEVHNAAGRAVWGPRAQQVTAEEIRGTHRATDQRRTAWAAVDGSRRMVGAVVLIEPLRENRDTAGMWLSVHPEHWRRGVGSLLLSHAEAAAAGAGRSRTVSYTHLTLPTILLV